MRLVTDYLDKTEKKYPEKIAIVDGKVQISFKKLREHARRTALELEGMNLFKQPVVVYMEKCHECIESFMGIAYSGNFYVPIDVSMPGTRIQKILDVLHPQAVITKKTCEEKAKEFFSDITIIYYEDLGTINESREPANPKRLIDTDILYVLFTSGSTGTPKGVTICHRSVIDYTEWVTAKFRIDENHIFGNQAPFYFDNSILDIYQMLKTGATLHIIPESLFSFPLRLLEYIKDNEINIIFWVPSALCLVANLKALGKRDITCIKKVLFCGEVMPVKQLNAWRKVLPDALYANLYGPTEITDVCTYYIVDREFDEKDPLPIGYACENTDILVLNEEDKVVEPGGCQTGELCVRGTSLALGYYNNPERTSEVFIQNPLNVAYPELIYRTGDLVRYNEYGELIYCSRKDFQIKHMGHRIEMGEIETVVNAMNGITNCCCVYDSRRQKIVLVYTGTKSEADITSESEKYLPEYMIPGKIYHIDHMPLNSNGKIDRVLLADQYAGQGE